VTKYEWKPYLNVTEIKSNGVSAAADLYVGGGVHNGQEGPSTIDKDGKCTYVYSDLSYLVPCKYLVDETNKFKWVPSQNGATVLGSVMYGTFQVARVEHKVNGVSLGMRVGEVYNGAIYYPYGGRTQTAHIYEVLIYSTYGTFE
jgi:hypothetical protein